MDKLKFEKFTWIVLSKPNQETLEGVFSKYKIESIDISSILKQDSRAKLDIYKNYNYLKLNFLKFFKNKEAFEINEMHNIYGKDFLITVTTYSSRKVKSLISQYEEGNFEGPIEEFIHKILENQISKGARIVDYMEEEIDELEKEAYTKVTKETIKVLSKKRKNLTVFKHNLSINIPVLEVLAKSMDKSVDVEMKIDFDNLVDKAHKTLQETLILEESILGLDNTVKSLFEVKNNDVIKKFTIISFVFIPLNLLAGIFGMNIQDVPFNTMVVVSLFISLIALIGLFFLFFRKSFFD